MPPKEKPQPTARTPRPQPALDEVFALLGQSNQLGLEQLLDHMRPEKGDR